MPLNASSIFWCFCFQCFLYVVAAAVACWVVVECHLWVGFLFSILLQPLLVLFDQWMLDVADLVADDATHFLSSLLFYFLLFHFNWKRVILLLIYSFSLSVSRSCSRWYLLFRYWLLINYHSPLSFWYSSYIHFVVLLCVYAVCAHVSRSPLLCKFVCFYNTLIIIIIHFILYHTHIYMCVCVWGGRKTLSISSCTFFFLLPLLVAGWCRCSFCTSVFVVSLTGCIDLCTSRRHNCTMSVCVHTNCTCVCLTPGVHSTP